MSVPFTKTESSEERTGEEKVMGVVVRVLTFGWSVSHRNLCIWNSRHGYALKKYIGDKQGNRNNEVECRVMARVDVLSFPRPR